MDDTLDDEAFKGGEEEVDENYPIRNEMVDEANHNHMEVELDPDDPMEEDDGEVMLKDQSGRDSDCDEHELLIEEFDPLA